MSVTMRENPPEEELAPVVRLKWGLVFNVLCVRDGVTDDEAAEEATMQDPPGTSLNEWVVAELDPAKDWHAALISENQRCSDYPNRRHLVVSC